MTEDARPVRQTRQRAAVASALKAADGFRTAQQIHDDLSHQGASVGLATVYRTLQALADAGEADVIRTPDGQSAYGCCSAGHHHHLVCRSCGRSVEFKIAGLESIIAETASTHGFSDVAHEFEIFGTCAGCSTR